ncbi:hypothetical protein [Roseovarius aestuarii]|uniref:Uncharacterized protein n=1 Tax=Roseovarius aestuarii TaxID=475083 RepID=A0A1X7BRN9_9RHOB|nr:hypothetical protein [Roseovarius aestuarii]SMC12263.1 hypothetical protein ROA7745_02087 [Roseovarius aestuarii]
MQQLRALWAASKTRAPEILREEQNGIVLLTLMPFMISGIIFAPWNAEMTAELALSPQVYLPWVAVVLVGVAVAAALVTRALAPAVASVSALILLAIALKDQRPLEAFGLGALITPPEPPQEGQVLPEPYRFFQGIEMTTFFTLYTLTGLLSLLAATLQPTLSRMLFRTVLIVLILDLILFSFFGGRTLAGALFRGYFPSQISVLISLTVLMVLRMLVKFKQENRGTHQATKKTDPRLLRSVRKTTLKLWWPMPLIFLFFLILYIILNDRWVHQPMIRTLNSLEASGDVTVYEGGAALPSPDFAGAPPDTVESAAEHAVERLVNAQTAAITARIRAEQQKFDGNTDAVLNATREVMPGRFPGTRTRRCGFLDFGCYIQNGIKSMINSAYVSARENMLEDFRRDLERADGGVANNSAAAIAEVERRAGVMKAQTRRRINDTATGLRYFGLASLLFSILILIKSQMIVFARVFYARVPFRAATAEEEDEATAGKIGKTTARGSQLELRSTDGHARYYLAFRACGNNVVDRRRIPQPLQLVIKRLFSRNLAMCLVDFEADKQIKSCDLIVDPPAEILEWNLLEGDEVFVDISTLIGFSEGCRLGRTISLSLGALIFGRAIYHSVKGPGRLFLRTESKPLVGAGKATRSIMQSSSLIAWRRDAQFNIVSSLTVSDTFLSSFSVRKADRRQHVVVYDTSQCRRVGMGGGILRMVRAFLLPF